MNQEQTSWKPSFRVHRFGFDQKANDQETYVITERVCLICDSETGQITQPECCFQRIIICSWNREVRCHTLLKNQKTKFSRMATLSTGNVFLRVCYGPRIFLPSSPSISGILFTLIPPRGGLDVPDCRAGISSSLPKLTNIAWRVDRFGPARHKKHIFYSKWPNFTALGLGRLLKTKHRKVIHKEVKCVFSSSVTRASTKEKSSFTSNSSLQSTFLRSDLLWMFFGFNWVWESSEHLQR